MFCTTIRKRSQWAPVVAVLLENSRPRYHEKTLSTHDISVPIIRPDQTTEYIQLLLVSASDLLSSGERTSDGMARIERLYHLNGGGNACVIYLLEKGEKDITGMVAYMGLQACLLKSRFEMPLLPLAMVSSLPKIISLYAQSLVGARTAAPPIYTMTAVLPFCSANPPLMEHSRNILSDMVPSLKDLARTATTTEGQMAIRQWLTSDERQAGQADDVIDFWSREYTC